MPVLSPHPVETTIFLLPHPLGGRLQDLRPPRRHHRRSRSCRGLPDRRPQADEPLLRASTRGSRRPLPRRRPQEDRLGRRPDPRRRHGLPGDPRARSSSRTPPATSPPRRRRSAPTPPSASRTSSSRANQDYTMQSAARYLAAHFPEAPATTSACSSTAPSVELNAGKSSSRKRGEADLHMLPASPAASSR